MELDDELIRRIGERRALVLEAGRIKEALGLPVMDPAREATVVRRMAERARELGVDEELARDVVWRIIASARSAQAGETAWGPPPRPGTNRPRGSSRPYGQG
ncbi:MAG: chorismate mutase [Longimicrobiales bacterium]